MENLQTILLKSVDKYLSETKPSSACLAKPHLGNRFKSPQAVVYAFVLFSFFSYSKLCPLTNMRIALPTGTTIPADHLELSISTHIS